MFWSQFFLFLYLFMIKGRKQKLLIGAEIDVKKVKKKK